MRVSKNRLLPKAHLMKPLRFNLQKLNTIACIQWIIWRVKLRSEIFTHYLANHIYRFTKITQYNSMHTMDNMEG
jgi:hypothetical protein